MDFKVKTSYSLDLLNFIIILTGDEFYVNRHMAMLTALRVD